MASYLDVLPKKWGAQLRFETPQDLWDAALEYFQWMEDNPAEVHDIKGKDNEDVEIRRRRPYTVVGFCIFHNIDRQTFYNYESDENGWAGFGEVARRIIDICKLNRLEGAITNEFNTNVIVRLDGLVDTREIKGEVEFKKYKIFDPLTYGKEDTSTS